MRPLSTRAAVIGGLAGLALLVAGTPGFATAPATPVLGFDVRGVALTPSQPSIEQTNSVTVSDPSVRELDNLQVTIDTSALPPGVSIDMSNQFGWNCATASTLTTCTATGPVSLSWYAGGHLGYSLMYLNTTYTMDPGASPAAGSITATVSATGLPSETVTRPVDVAEDVELVAAPVPSVSLADGGRFAERWTVTNAGSTTVHGADLYVESEYGFDFVHTYTNCRYSSGPTAVCAFDNDLLPGATYAISVPMGFAIARDHEAPWRGATTASWYPPVGLEVGLSTPTGVAGHGSALTLVDTATGAAAPPATAGAPQYDTNYLNASFVNVTVTGSKAADLAAVGATASIPAVGGTARLALGIKDVGPASAAPSRSGDPVVDATVTLPGGTTATAVPLNCAPIVSGQPDWNQTGLPGFAVYNCVVYTPIGLHRTYQLPFTVQTTVAQPTYQGSISLGSDVNTANNTATILIQGG